MYLLFRLDPAHGVVEEGDEVAGDAGYRGVYQTGHHERVVQQVLADDGGTRSIEVHGGDIRGIVSLVMMHKCCCLLWFITNLTIVVIVILNILKDI